MRCKKDQLPKEPPAGSPCARAKALNTIAEQIPLQITSLPQNERKYVQAIHKVLIRYWHLQISKDEAQAVQRLWQISCPQTPGGDFGREG